MGLPVIRSMPRNEFFRRKLNLINDIREFVARHAATHPSCNEK
jgi:hypothetical protein